MDINFDVLIIGGGIAGFATAAFLRQRGPWRIAIVERRQEAAVIRNTNDNDDPHDFGIALASNGCAMLSLLGMSDPVEELNGCELEKSIIRPANNPDNIPPDLTPTRMLFGEPSLFCRRSALINWLCRKCVEKCKMPDKEPVTLFFGKHVMRVDVKSGTVEDSEGDTYKGSLLVGADGIGKVSRQTVLAQPNGGETKDQSNFSIQCAYMSIISQKELVSKASLNFLVDFVGREDNRPVGTLTNFIYNPPLENQSEALFFQRQQRVILYPIDHDGNHQLFAYMPFNEDISAKFAVEVEDETTENGGTQWTKRRTLIKNVQADQATAHFSMSHPEICELLNQAATINLCIIQDSDPIAIWSSMARLVLVGDAAHAAVPHTGQGAAQALEDADALSHFLSVAQHESEQNTVDLPPLEEPLRQYEALRIPRAHRIQNAARLANGTHDGLSKFDWGTYNQEIMTWRGAASLQV